MIIDLYLKHNNVVVPIMVYDNNGTMYIDESVKHILLDMRNEYWILWANVLNNRHKEIVEIDSGYIRMESVKLGYGIYPNYVKGYLEKK